MMKKTSQRRSPKPPGNFKEEEKLFLFFLSHTQMQMERDYLMFPAECDAPQQFIFHSYIQSGGLYI